MREPPLPDDLFLRDRVLSREPIFERKDSILLQTSAEIVENGVFRAPENLTVQLRLPFNDLSRFDRLSVTLLNESSQKLLVGMKLIHGPDEEAAVPKSISTSGGREELLPGEWRELNFPRECFGIYGFPRGWTDIREIGLAVARERFSHDTGEFRIQLERVEGQSRCVSAGPRLTEEGLALVLGKDVARTTSATTDRAFSLQEQIIAHVAHELPMPYRAGDQGLDIPPPHPFPRESADDILSGRIMGQPIGRPIRWGANPLGALEWTHYLNRHHFLRELLSALVSTEDRKYALAIHRTVAAWIEANPVPLDSNGGAGPSWETLSAAWRLREWLWIIGIAWKFKSFTPDTKIKMLCSVWEHARSLMDHRGHTNNWIIVESAALSLAGICFPEFLDAGLWVETGLTRLGTEIRRQFFSDGAHFEISPLYHSICFHALLEVKQAAEARGMSLPEEFGRVLEKGADYLAALCRPDFTWPAMNDSGGYAGDYSALMRKAGEVLQRPELAWIGSSGRVGAAPVNKSCVLPDAGIGIMRSHYGPNANFLVFRAGPAGAAHVHRDVLSLDVTALGQPRLVDPGITGYDPDRLTDHYRSAQAHNTILVNGRGRDLSKLSFKDKIRPAGTDFFSSTNGDLEIATGLCAGPWHDEETDCKLLRTVVFVKARYWIVRDIVQSSANPEITVCWQFVPGRVEVEIKTLSALFLDVRGSCLQVLPLLGHLDARVQVSTGQLHPPGGWVSRDGTDLPATSCFYLVAGPWPATLIWLLMPSSGLADRGRKAVRTDEGGSVIVEVSYGPGRTDRVLFPPPREMRESATTEDSFFELIRLL